MQHFFAASLFYESEQMSTSLSQTSTHALLLSYTLLPLPTLSQTSPNIPHFLTDFYHAPFLIDSSP